jgi:hypothetical protein
MALADLTGNFRNKKFEGGVGGGASPIYGGPEPDLGEDVSPETLKASVMGIYEKYGRSAKGIRMAKASPEYAALQSAGINVFGTPTSNNSGMDSNRKQTTNIENASDEAKAKAASQYAALEGRSRGRTPRTSSSSLTQAVNGGAEVTTPAPAPNTPRVPESTPQTAQSTSMSVLNPPAPKSEEVKKPEPTTPADAIKSQDTTNNMAARDKINRQSLRGGASGITAQDATSLGYGKGLEGQGNRMLDNSDASVKMIRADEKNKLQDEREAMKKEYNSQASAVPNQPSPFVTPKGKTYQGPGGKEFIGSNTSDGFIGVPSENQNKIDDKARANLKKKYSGPSLQS